MTGNIAISCAQCCPGTKRTSLAMFPILSMRGQPLTLPEKAKCVLSEVRIRGMIVADSGGTEGLESAASWASRESMVSCGKRNYPLRIVYLHSPPPVPTPEF
jgi:hypothetical protein